MTDKLNDLIDKTISEWKSRTFEWSDTDCGFSTALYVEKVKGVDPLSEYRGKYPEEEKLYNWLDPHGGVLGVFTKAMAKIGIYPNINNTPRRGDVVFAEYQGIEAVGLCLGEFCIFKTKIGAFMTKRALIKRVWQCDLD